MVPVGRVGERRVVSRHSQFFAIDPEWRLIKNLLTPSRKVPPFAAFSVGRRRTTGEAG
jgi:hypothetical protein